MTKDLPSEEWITEFQTFLSAETVAPPKRLSVDILTRVRSDLNPASWLVFSKIALIHTIVGSLTLLICPQFGISAFGGMGLMGLLMSFGETVCMLGCGAVFLGTSAFASSFVLRPEEVKVVRKNELLQLSILGLLSVGVFVCAGAATVGWLAFIWLVGSIVGGLATLELGWKVRTHFRRSFALSL